MSSNIRVTRLNVKPTSKVQVQCDNEHLISLSKIDELDRSPPFTVLYFEVIPASSQYSLDSNDVNDPIRQITARYQDIEVASSNTDEEKNCRK